MGNLYIEETRTNATEGYSYGDSGVYETFTDNKGELFRSLQKEFGRCTSCVYIDTANGIKSVGWVFQKKQRYSDCNKFYLAETWVTVHSEQPTKTITHHYF